MLQTILNALTPIAVAILFGYFAGRSKAINQEGARCLSTVVLDFGLPCALFVATFRFSPSQFENVPYLLTLLIGITLPFFLALLLARLIWKMPLDQAALFGNNNGFPDMAYFGLPVVLTILGTEGLLPVLVGNIITSLIIIPVVIALLIKGQSGSAAKARLHHILLTTIRKPIVWAPLLGLALVLMGFKLPPLADASLKLLASMSGGLALFTLGVLLSFLTARLDAQVLMVLLIKNLAMPALVLGLALAFKLDGRLAQGAVLITACPAATMGAMLSAQFRVAQDRIPAQILASNIAAIFTMALWIYVTEKIF